MRGLRFAAGWGALALALLGCGRTALERDPGACASCDSQRASCGAIDDGCGHTVQCGTCVDGLVCGGDGTPNVCSPYCTGGWCWQRPLPQGNDLSDAWRSDSGKLFVVGSGGTAMEWDGAQWLRFSFAGETDLLAVWGSSELDLWAGGTNGVTGTGGTLWHFDGASWSAAEFPQAVLALGGTGPSDVWAATLAGPFHFDGQRWAKATSWTFPGVRRIRAFSSADVWAVGDFGAFHFDGTTWSQVTLPPGQWVEDLDGTGPSDLWAVGGQADSAGRLTALIEHWDGATWSSLANLPWPRVGAASWNTVLVRSRGDVWVAGGDGDVVHFDGARWETVPTETSATLSRLTGGETVFAVGRGGTVLSWRNGAWRSLEGGQGSFLLALWGSSSRDVWTAGADGYASHFDDGAWTPAIGLDEPRHDLGTPGTQPLLGHDALWGTARDDVWAVSRVGIADAHLQHFDGISWSQPPLPPVSGGPLQLGAGCSTSADDAWAVGTAVFHWDGLAWSAVAGAPGSGILRAASCVSTNDVWFAGGLQDGSGGEIWHWNGQHLTRVFSDTTAFSSIWAKPGEVWAVGSRVAKGIVFHFDGQRWTELDWTGAVAGRDVNERNVELEAVTGNGSDVWVVTNFGFLLHFDGHTWSREPTGKAGLLSKLWHAPDGSRWVSGLDDAILFHPP